MTNEKGLHEEKEQEGKILKRIDDLSKKIDSLDNSIRIPDGEKKSETLGRFALGLTAMGIGLTVFIQEIKVLFEVNPSVHVVSAIFSLVIVIAGAYIIFSK
ncbi:MAG: hypothetical protein ACLFO6_05935 [Archaeoglobaceae archaeon]